jgi:hypothetical protein
MMYFIADNGSLPILPFTNQIINASILGVVVTIVDTKVAKNLLLSLFDSDLRVAYYQVVRVVSYGSLALGDRKYLLLRKGHNDPSSICSFIRIESTLRVCSKEETRCCLDYENNVRNPIDVSMKGSNIEEVHLIDERGSVNSPLLDSLDISLEEIFVIGVIGK